MTSPNTQQIGTINVTPLIDILLVLLIIFMVITPLTSHGLPAELPQTAMTTATQQPEPEIVLELTRDHKFLLNNQPVPRNQLVAEVTKLYTNRASHQLFLRADPDLEYREIALTMDALRGAQTPIDLGLLSKK